MSYPMYQVFPRSDMEGVIAGTIDGGPRMHLHEAHAEAGRICGKSATTVAGYWRNRDRRSNRVYVAGPRYLRGHGVIIAECERAN